MITDNYLESIRKQFEYYKLLGEKAMAQVPDEKLSWQYNEDSNSIATIVKHLWGNMLSRWTGFLTSDGEKDWRNRDAEFENDIHTRDELMQKWNEGWNCLLRALNALAAGDLDKIVYIRNEGHTVMEAVNRQFAHYIYHVGQIVLLSKMCADNGWVALTIPKGNSEAFNKEKFSQPRARGHFTDDFLKEKKN